MSDYSTFNDKCRELLNEDCGNTIRENLSRHRERLRTPLHTIPPPEEVNKKIHVQRWRDFQSHENLLIDIEDEIRRSAIWAKSKKHLIEILRQDIYDHNVRNILYFRSTNVGEVDRTAISNLETIKIEETSFGREYNADEHRASDSQSYTIASRSSNDLGDYFQNKYGFDTGNIPYNMLAKHNNMLSNKLSKADYLILEADFAVSEGGLFGFYNEDGSLLQMIDKIGRGIIIVPSSRVHADQEILEETHYLSSRNKTGNPWYPNLLLLKGSSCLENFTIVITHKVKIKKADYLNEFFYTEREHKQIYDPLFLSVGNPKAFVEEGESKIEAFFNLLDGWSEKEWPLQGRERRTVLLKRRDAVESKDVSGKEKILMRLWKRTMLKRSRLNAVGRSFYASLIKQFLNLFPGSMYKVQRRATRSFNEIWQENQPTL